MDAMKEEPNKLPEPIHGINSILRACPVRLSLVEIRNRAGLRAIF
jgi:hypothetical protein